MRLLLPYHRGGFDNGGYHFSGGDALLAQAQPVAAPVASLAHVLKPKTSIPYIAKLDPQNQKAI